MFVCICNAIKEKEIQQAIHAGHTTFEALQNTLNVATCCGGCQPMIESYLDDFQTKMIDENLFIQVA